MKEHKVEPPSVNQRRYPWDEMEVGDFFYIRPNSVSGLSRGRVSLRTGLYASINSAKERKLNPLPASYWIKVEGSYPRLRVQRTA